MYNEQKLTDLKYKLSAVKEPWAITGGANHYIRGILNHINDIDIITTKEGGYEISKLLFKYMLLSYKFRSSNKIRSYFGKAVIHNSVVEFFGEPYNYSGNEWVKNDRWQQELEIISIQGVQVPLTTLDYEIYIYELLENESRVKILKESLK